MAGQTRTAGWQIALRLASREIRRYTGRSALIMVLIGVPVLLLSWLLTYIASTNLSALDATRAAVGTGQAVVIAPVDRQIEQEGATASGMTYTDAPALTVPGYEVDATAAVTQLLGSRAVPLTRADATTTVSGKQLRLRLAGIGLQPTDDLGSRARLVSGHWPISDTEVTVTRWGVSRGLPSSGTISLQGDEAAPRTVTVVGVSDALADTVVDGAPMPADLVTRPQGQPAGWLVLNRGPLEWTEVDALNEHGMLVQSLAAAESPRPSTSRDPDAASGVMLVAAGGTGILLLTVLLAGPAFAVSASRSRRSLALLASNGATPAQLRRPLLAQAIILGAATALIGTALGVGVFALTRRWLALHLDERAAYGFRLSPVILVVALFAVVSAVIAALVPSRSLGRLDISAAIAGKEVSPPARTSHAVLGAILLAVGAALCLTAGDSTGSQQTGVGLVGGIVAVTVGALLIVPGLLALLGRLAPRLPATLRMAVRDTARQRSRTAPTVAAVMAGAALLSGTLVAINSDTAEREFTYVPFSYPGTATLSFDDSPQVKKATAALAGVGRELKVVALRPLVNVEGAEPWANVPGAEVTDVRAGTSVCTAEQVVTETSPDSTIAWPPPCSTLGTTTMSTNGDVATAPVDDLTALLELDATQHAAVAAGAVVLPDLATVPSPPRPGSLDTQRPLAVAVTNGSVRFWQLTGTRNDMGELTVIGAPKAVDVPALHLPWDQFSRGLGSTNSGAYLSSEAAAAHGWHVAPTAMYRVVDPAGPISSDVEQRANAKLKEVGEFTMLRVERGFSPGDELIPLLIVTGIIALIILVATLTSTALSMSEQQSMMGTLAAIGATRMTRRRIAAGQAVLVGGLGALVGCAIGLLPGIASARSVTITRQDGPEPTTIGPFIEIPWAWMGLTVLTVAVVAGVFAFSAIRRAPTVTRRLT